MPAKQIKNRTTFYISGFDPRGPSFYHRLFREEAAKHNANLGSEIEVSDRKKDGKNSKWQVTEGKTKTNYVFLQWDDIIRKFWVKQPLQFLLSIFKTYFYFIFGGAFTRAAAISYPPAVSLIYPFLIVLAVLVGSWFGVHMFLDPGIISIPIYIGLVYLAHRGLAKSNAYWLVRLYNFCAIYAAGKAPELDKRVEEFATTLKKEISKKSVDEVLLIGHSAGSVVLSLTLTRLLKSSPRSKFKKLKIITMGQCIPVLSFLKGAKGKDFCDDLEFLSTKNLYWLDVTAPSDSVCFALNGPFVGICDNQNPRLKIISARFHKMFDPEKYQKIKKDRLETHFLYLMSADEEVEFDYFEIVAGGKCLEERFCETPTAPSYGKFRLGAS